MTIDLPADDVDVIREIVQARLHELSTEINRTDSLEFKEQLRRQERALGRFAAQLGSQTTTR